MQHVIQQLERVRTMGRVLLVARRGLQFLTVLLAAAVAAGLVDYLLRLPGWLRLLVGLLAAAAAAWWVVTRIGHAIGFRPDLSALALRAEKMYPQLAGALASGVEFAAHPDDYADPQRTATLAQSSIDQAQQRLGAASLAKLLNPTPTLRTGVVALIAVVITGGIVLAAPDPSALALQRWLLPLGDAQWPKRNTVASLVNETIQPADTPLRLRAGVDKGYSHGMRAWAHYCVADGDGQFRQWRRVLMSEQNAQAGPKGQVRGVFERLIDLTADLNDQHRGGVPAEGARVSFFFEAGDDQTQPQTIRLVPRPAVEAVTVQVVPPEYAKGLAPVETFALDRQPGRTAVATGLVGSTINLHIELNKPVRDVAMTTPAALEPSAHEGKHAIDLSFTLTETFETAIHLTDEHGLESLSDRVYRIEAREDKQPTVSIIDPPADETVLATAVVGVKGLARDDVGVETIAIVASLPPESPAPGTDAKRELRVLEKNTGREERLSVETALDLGELALRPGDQVILLAAAQDVLDLNGRRHEAVQSSPRILRIVDTATLTSQLRSELANVRQSAMRLEQRQNEIRQDRNPAQAQPRQQQLTQTLQRQGDIIEQLKQRIARNKLNDDQINHLIDRAGKQLDEAAGESSEASKKLDEARQAQDAASKAQQQQDAAAHQEKVAAALRELIDELDQGKNALSVQMQLRQLDAAQKALAGQTRQLLPKTAGQDRDDLSEEDRKALDRIAQEQQRLAEQADALVQQMKATAESIRREAQSPREKATAQALDEAAATAQREGLRQQMDQAAQDAQENKLSQASQQQSQASQTMAQMMQQMQDGRQERQQQMLRRLLMQLGESIAKLIEQQKAHLSRVEEAQQLLPLADALNLLRRNTMAVAQEARGSDKTAGVANHLDAAVAAQADAINHLRAGARDDAMDAEAAALASLEEALKAIEQLRQQEQQEQTNQQRDELKTQYEALAKRQDEIRERTAALADQADLNRRQRAELIQLSNEEADLKAEVEKLAEKVKATLVFRHLHGQIDAAAQRIVAKLQREEADLFVLSDQAGVARQLRLMAAALEQARKDESPFDQPQSDSAQQAGGQGGQQQQPIIPTISELRLLRGVQETVYLTTRAIDEGKIDTPAAADRIKLLENLAQQQADLNALGETLIKRMRNRMQEVPNIVLPEKSDLPPKPDKN